MTGTAIRAVRLTKGCWGAVEKDEWLSPQPLAVAESQGETLTGPHNSPWRSAAHWSHRIQWFCTKHPIPMTGKQLSGHCDPPKGHLASTHHDLGAMKEGACVSPQKLINEKSQSRETFAVPNDYPGRGVGVMYWVSLWGLVGTEVETVWPGGSDEEGRPRRWGSGLEIPAWPYLLWPCKEK